MTGPSIWDELVDELGDPLDPDAAPRSAEPTDPRIDRRPGFWERLRADWDRRGRAEAWFIAVALAVFVTMLVLTLLGVFPALVLLS